MKEIQRLRNFISDGRELSLVDWTQAAADLEMIASALDEATETVYQMGSLPWVAEMKRLGHVCTDRPKPATCAACDAEKVERDAQKTAR